jgi:hypothetical protein
VLQVSLRCRLPNPLFFAFAFLPIPGLDTFSKNQRNMASSYAATTTQSHQQMKWPSSDAVLCAFFPGSVLSLRTLIPPKIASVGAISGAPSAKRMESVLEFYSKVGDSFQRQISGPGVLIGLCLLSVRSTSTFFAGTSISHQYYFTHIIQSINDAARPTTAPQRTSSPRQQRPQPIRTIQGCILCTWKRVWCTHHPCYLRSV